MGRIKIKNLPEDMKISPDEMKRVRGGSFIIPIMHKSTGFMPKLEMISSNLVSIKELQFMKF